MYNVQFILNFVENINNRKVFGNFIEYKSYNLLKFQIFFGEIFTFFI